MAQVTQSAMASQFTPGQRKFIDTLASKTGLNRRVLGAWVLSEMNGSAAAGREREGNNNWLNIAYYDSGPGGITKDRVWRSPESAANATAQFLRGQKFGPSSGIRKIIHTRDRGPDAQIAAIANSGWASSGYNGGSTLRSVYGRLDWMGGDAPTRQRALEAVSPASSGASKQRFDSAAYEDARKKSVLAGYLAKHQPQSSLVRMGVLDSTPPNPADYVQEVAQQKAAATRSTSGGGTIRADSGDDSFVGKLKSRANAIDAKKLPYLWGGGHGGKVNAYKATPLDCSGAVSAVLGIDPRVSGEFTKWGKPGRGGRVTIYANDKHVLMEIDGHFFGTSQTNPGGGAGWIPRGKVSASYLRNFTARHV